MTLCPGRENILAYYKTTDDFYFIHLFYLLIINREALQEPPRALQGQAPK